MVEYTMGRVTKFTNFVLLYLVLLVLLLIGLAIVLYPFDSTKVLIFFILAFGINVLGAVVAGILHVTLISKDSIWLQPASTRVGAILINSVVSVWLCVVGLLIFIMLQGKGTTTVVFVVLLLILAGVGFGRYLQKHFSSSSWLPYGISFFGALVLTIVIFAATKYMGGME